MPNFILETPDSQNPGSHESQKNIEEKEEREKPVAQGPQAMGTAAGIEKPEEGEGRPAGREHGHERSGARGTAAMDPETRKEVARKGGLAVSRNRQHMAEIGRKGGQSVSKNRDHMAQIGRKGGAASRGHRG